jgi:hypothetical protein
MVTTGKYEVTVNMKRSTVAPDDLRRISVEVRIDIEGIAQELGRKAYRSARNRSNALGGLVRVVYLGTREVGER